MGIILSTINIGIVPLVAFIWFWSYLMFMIGRCDATNDILDTKIGKEVPPDIARWTENWHKKHPNSK